MGIGRVVLAVGLVAAAALGALWWRSTGQAEPWQKPATFDGREVSVTYTGSQCQDSADLRVDETAGRVTLTVVSRDYALRPSCSDVGVEYELTAVLERPVGEREVVDGACTDGVRHIACRSDAPVAG